MVSAVEEELKPAGVPCVGFSQIGDPCARGRGQTTRSAKPGPSRVGRRASMYASALYPDRGKGRKIGRGRGTYCGRRRYGAHGESGGVTPALRGLGKGGRNLSRPSCPNPTPVLEPRSRRASGEALSPNGLQYGRAYPRWADMAICPSYLIGNAPLYDIRVLVSLGVCCMIATYF